jgi:hypothetical protein
VASTTRRAHAGGAGRVVAAASGGWFAGGDAKHTTPAAALARPAPLRRVAHTKTHDDIDDDGAHQNRE